MERCGGPSFDHLYYAYQQRGGNDLQRNHEHNYGKDVCT